MSSAAVSSERIRALFQAYREEAPYEQWRGSYRASLERVQNLDEKALETPAVQEELWSLRALATLGPGDSVNVQGAWTDPEIVREIVGLRALGRVTDDAARAAQLQAAFLKILGLVTPRPRPTSCAASSSSPPSSSATAAIATS